MTAQPARSPVAAAWMLGRGLLWLLLSALLVVLSTWPMAAQLQGHLLEPLHLPDVQGGMFWPWAAARALAQGDSPYLRPELMWPAGQDVRLIVWNHGVQLVIFPFFLGLDPVAATNLAALWIATLNGAAGAWAGWAASRSRAGALAGLALAACAPYGVVEAGVGRPEQGLWAPLALFMGGLARLWADPRDRTAILACGLGTALAGAVYWFYAIFLAVLLAAVLPLAALLRSLDAARLRGLVVAGGVAVVAVLPFLLPVVAALAGSNTSVVGEAIAGSDPTAVLQARAPLLLPWGHLGPWAQGAERAWRAPLLALAACLLALVRAPGGVRWAAAMGVLAALLAAGPVWLGPDGAPVGSGTGFSVQLPQALLNHTAVFARFWWPYRWQAPLLAAGTVALGAVVGRLGGRRAWLAALLVVGWSGGEAAWMLRDGGRRPVLGPAEVSPLFTAIGALDPAGGPRPILQLPSAWLRNSRVGWIAWHHQPIDGGMGLGMLQARAAAHQAALARIPLVAQIFEAAAGGTGADAPEVWRREDAGGYHYVVLYAEGPTREREALQQGLRRVLGVAFYEDPSLRAWVVPGVGEIPPELAESE